MKIKREIKPSDSLLIRTTYTTDNFIVVVGKTIDKKYIILLKNKKGHYITNASSYISMITTFKEVRRKYMLRLFSHI